MAESTQTYTRLPGSSRAMFTLATRSRCRLYDGGDHMLLVRNNAYEELYERFYYADIQALSVGQTNRGKIVNLAWGMAGLVWALCALASLFSSLSYASVGTVTSGIIGGFFTLPLLLNLALGPTATYYVATATRTTQLPCISRLRAARKLNKQILPLIERFQGSSDVQSAQAHIVRDPQILSNSRVPLRRANTTGHWILFGIILLDAPLSILGLLQPSPSPGPIDYFLFVVLVISLISAIVLQNRSDIGYHIRAVTWMTVSYLVCTIFFIFVLAVQEMMRGEFTGTFSPDTYGIPHLVSIPVDIGIGLSGLYLLFQRAASARRASGDTMTSGAPPSSPPPTPDTED